MLVRFQGRGHLLIANESANWYSHCGNQYGDSSKSLKIDLPQNTAMPLFGAYSTSYCSSIFTATLFIRVRTWK